MLGPGWYVEMLRDLSVATRPRLFCWDVICWDLSAAFATKQVVFNEWGFFFLKTENVDRFLLEGSAHVCFRVLILSPASGVTHHSVTHYRLLSPWIQRCITPLQVAEYKAEWAKLDKESANCVPRSLNAPKHPIGSIGLLWLIPPWKQFQHVSTGISWAGDTKCLWWEAEGENQAVGGRGEDLHGTSQVEGPPARHHPPFGPLTDHHAPFSPVWLEVGERIQPAEFMNMWASIIFEPSSQSSTSRIVPNPNQ